MPDGYDSQLIRSPVVDNSPTREEYPDIILILNESFCDLDYYSNISADQDYLSPFYDIAPACHGYTFSFEVGGGTNNSEFELLTSCSMEALNLPAPFSYLHFSEENSTLVSYLHQLGYTTYAMHAMPGTNYSRNIAYPEMGFDHVLLGEGSYCEANRVGNRLYLDQDEYVGLETLYENESPGPRFFYLLTFQNHGGYEQNDSSLDTVHTRMQFGSLTDDIDEYLSSVSLSAKAIGELIDYFSACERPVMICMLGDHAPAFIGDLPGKNDFTSDESELRKRAVPFMIWSNFDSDFPRETTFSSMTDLVPLLLSYAKMPMTPFYQQILNLHEMLPVRTGFGVYLEPHSEFPCYTLTEEMYDSLTQYSFMEYNELSNKADYMPDLFMIP